MEREALGERIQNLKPIVTSEAWDALRDPTTQPPSSSGCDALQQDSPSESSDSESETQADAEELARGCAGEVRKLHPKKTREDFGFLNRRQYVECVLTTRSFKHAAGSCSGSSGQDEKGTPVYRMRRGGFGRRKTSRSRPSSPLPLHIRKSGAVPATVSRLERSYPDKTLHYSVPVVDSTTASRNGKEIRPVRVP